MKVNLTLTENEALEMLSALIFIDEEMSESDLKSLKRTIEKTYAAIGWENKKSEI